MAKEAAKSVGIWVAVADSRAARLFSGALTPHGRLHLVQRGELVETWEEKEHGRPTARSSPHGPARAPQSHEEEERLHRFAREVAGWLERELGAQGIERVHAFCAKRLLGPLGKALTPRIAERVVRHAADLARLTPGELEVHATIVAAEREERARGSAAGER